ncbi:MAG: FAD-dependent oxidoreductase [Kiritimatiellae bacterium]|jgi:hypothetical protein|nr:FAD-dependent oxidoreductase [Kiritimatiellia bacterium]
MKTVEFKQNLELNNDYEVIVVGGGPAGCTAAAAAAREGAKTLLIEATGALGGMGTSGLVPAWCPFTDYEKIIYRGMGEKVLRTCIAGMPHVKEDHLNWTPIDPELLKRIYDDLVTENGAEVLFNSMLSAVNTDDNGSVESIVIANKAGLTAYKADVYIDCSGDADLAVWAGAEYEQGDEEGDLQATTHCFMLANVDDYAYIYGERLHAGNPNSPIHAIYGEGKYPLISDTHSCNNQIVPGVVGFNAGHIWDVDNTKPKTVSNALIQGRKIAYEFQKALAEYAPAAFSNAKIVATGALLGVRETRRIIGDYYLTAAELMEFKSFDDEICRNSYFIDVHRRKSKRMGSTFRFPQGKSHGLPYRCLVPKGIKNVLVAGRSISTDREAQGSTRVMPVCLAMGEAAGIAAKMAARENSGDVHAVNTNALRDKLKEHGAYLP